jgi:hypothetical protein
MNTSYAQRSELTGHTSTISVHSNHEQALEGAVRWGAMTRHARTSTEVSGACDYSGLPFPISVNTTILAASNIPVPIKRLSMTNSDLVTASDVKFRLFQAHAVGYSEELFTGTVIYPAAPFGLAAPDMAST